MEFRYDTSPLGQVKRTPQGGIEAPANLTRTGIFNYRRADGTIQRELRPAEEVFHPDSLATLRGAPLTVGHQGLVRTDNYRSVTVGNVADDVHPDGKYVVSRVRVQDKSTVEAVERKDLTELSCGYTCDVEHAPGEFQGEHYDAIQHNIRYNHVALGGKDFGRAGSDVKIRLDTAMLISMAEETLDQVRAARDAAVSRAEGLQKRLDGIDIEALVNDRLALVDGARKVLGAETKFDGKKDVDVMREVAAKAFPELKLDSASEDYLRGLFNAAVQGAAVSANRVARANVTVRSDSVEDKIAQARKRNEERSRNAWKGN